MPLLFNLWVVGLVADSASLRSTLYLSAAELVGRWSGPTDPRNRLYGLSL